MRTGKVYTFAINKTGYAASHTGGGGLERPIDVIFSSKGEMYIADFGLHIEENHGYEPGTGVIWKAKKR